MIKLAVRHVWQLITDHARIHFIYQFIQNNNCKAAAREIQAKLNELAKTLTEHADKFKQDRQELLSRKSEMLQEIRKFRREINAELDKLEKNSVDEIQNKVKQLEDKIEDSLKQLQAIKAMVTSVKDKLVTPNTNKADIFVNVKMGENTANVANKYIKDYMKSTTGDIEFHPERSILTQLEQNKSLGTLTVKPKTIIRSLIQIKGKESYSVKVKNDKLISDINSACFMEDGTIVMVDCNNMKLKLFDSNTYTVNDFCELTGYPHQICKINETQVAVTLRDKKEVHFISVKKEMKVTKKFTTEFTCYGLAHANNHLYISNSLTSVFMYTLSGRKITQFSIDQSGQRLFSDIQSLAVSKDPSRIYVADYNRGLIVFDNNGQVVSTFNDEQLKNANCCCLTETGDVLVSVCVSNNVLQFTRDGKLIGEVTEDDTKGRILSVCCNKQMSKMCITREDDIIEVYKI